MLVQGCWALRMIYREVYQTSVSWVMAALPSELSRRVVCSSNKSSPCFAFSLKEKGGYQETVSVLTRRQLYHEKLC